MLREPSEGDTSWLLLISPPPEQRIELLGISRSAPQRCGPVAAPIWKDTPQGGLSNRGRPLRGRRGERTRPGYPREPRRRRLAPQLEVLTSPTDNQEARPKALGGDSGVRTLSQRGR